MAAKNFPGPNINRIIEKDPQIIKIDMDYTGFGSRASIFGQLSGDPKSNNPAKPTAPEMTIKHTSGS